MTDKKTYLVNVRVIVDLKFSAVGGSPKWLERRVKRLGGENLIKACCIGGSNGFELAERAPRKMRIERVTARRDK